MEYVEFSEPLAERSEDVEDNIRKRKRQRNKLTLSKKRHRHHLHVETGEEIKEEAGDYKSRAHRSHIKRVYRKLGRTAHIFDRVYKKMKAHKREY